MKSRWGLLLVWPLLTLAAVGCGGTDSSDEPNGTGDVTARENNRSQTDATTADPPAVDLETLTNSIGIKLVLIPAGEFLMGSPESEEDREDNEQQHRVRITKPFYLGMHEVTVGQFRQFVTDSGYKTNGEKDGGGWGFDPTTREWGKKPEYTWRTPGFVQTDTHPVVDVTWNDAMAFCDWLSRKEGVRYRLPTEAEWEYGCRAGTTTLYYFGDDPESMALVGNVRDAATKQKVLDWDLTISGDDGYVFTAPVGRFRANDFGLYDMHGNVWEWCQDWHDDGYYASSPTDDPQGPSSATHYRVIRGGSWDFPARGCRSAYRNGSDPMNRYDRIGFRVAAVPSGAQARASQEAEPSAEAGGAEKAEPRPDVPE